MKNFIKEFKEFALKGNVMDMAIGVIIAGAFSAIVTSFTENIIQPILNCLGSADLGGLRTPLGSTGQYLDWGALLSAIVNFLIMALVLFTIIKAVNKASELTKKPEEEEAPAEPEKSDELKALEEIIFLLKKEKDPE